MQLLRSLSKPFMYDEAVGIAADSPDLDFVLDDYETFHQTYASAVKGDPVSIAAVAEGPKSLALELERDLAAIRRNAALGAADLSHNRFANPLAIEAQDDSLLIVDCLEEHTGSNLHSHSSFRLHEARMERNGDQWSVASFIPVAEQDGFSDHDYGCVPEVHRQIVLNSMPELLDLLDRFWFDPLSNYGELRQRVAPVQGQSQLDEFASFADSGLYLDGESTHTVRVRGSVAGPDFPLIAVRVCSESPRGLVSRRLTTGELITSGAGTVSLPPGSVILRDFLLVVDAVGSGKPTVQIGRVSSYEIEVPSCEQ